MADEHKGKGVLDHSLPELMDAVVCKGPQDYQFTHDHALPKVGTNEVLVRVTSCGICAGDAKCFHGAPMFWGDENRKAYCEKNVIPGHEFVGEVVALGEGYTGNLQVGDQTISEQIVPCWDCLYCKRGLYWLCEVHDIYGFHLKTFGGWAQYMKFPIGSINHKVPKKLTSHESVFIEPLSCAIHGVERGNVNFGDTVVVSGCGPIGLGMVAAAKMKNPARIVAVDLMDSRLDLARACGADIVLNPSKDNVVQLVKEMTGGYGCDVYLEATGNPKSVEQGLFSVRKAGTFVEFSVFAKPTTVDWTIIGDTKELNIAGAHLSGSAGYEHAIKMLVDRALPVDQIVSHKLPLQDFKDGIDLVSSGSKSLKVVLDA